MKYEGVVAVLICFFLVSCGQTDIEKSLFSGNTLARFLISHEGPANSAVFNMSNLNSYPSTELGMARRVFETWRTQSDAIVILELDHTETDDEGSGEFSVEFAGDGSDYFNKSHHWAGWSGGVMIPGEGLYSLQDSILKLTYQNNRLEDYISDDFSSKYRIEYVFVVRDAGLVLKSTDLGIPPAQIKTWGERYNVNLVSPSSVDSLAYTLSLNNSFIGQDVLCEECSSLVCNLWWEEMRKPSYFGSRIRRAFNLLKAYAEENDERLDWEELESLLYMVKNEDHACDQVRLTAASLRADIGWALATSNPFGREQVRYWEKYVLPAYCELQGEGVEGVEDWFTIEVSEVKPNATDVINSLALCGQSHYRDISTNPYTGRAEFKVCEDYFLQAIALGNRWGMNVSRIEEVLNSKREGFEEMCATRIWCR